MSEIALARINSFLLSEQQADFPVSPTIAVPVQVLQDLLETIQGLKDEVAQLREEHAQDTADLRQQIDTLTKNQDTLAENQYIQLKLINDLKNKAASEPTKKTVAHIDELYRLMIEEKTQHISIAKGARLLGLSKERLRQLKPLILKDGRFELGWSTTKGQKCFVIKIRQYLK
jgi:Fe2+ transport system protein B